MIKLSVVIITYNEEKDLPRTLDSVKELADEILIVDSFSTDRTKEISLRYKAKFIENKFEGHIQQKNFAAKIAKYKHVLSLDADEVLSPKLKEEIVKIKDNFSADGYTFNRLTNYCGTWIKHSGWYPDTKLRLWDKTKGEWGGTNPHDTYEMIPEAKIMHLKGDLLHYSYHSIHQHIEQANKFSEIGAIEAIKKGRKMNTLKVLLFPFWRFIRVYFIKRGFSDGYMGFIVCSISSYEAFLKYAKIKELLKISIKRNQL